MMFFCFSACAFPTKLNPVNQLMYVNHSVWFECGGRREVGGGGGCPIRCGWYVWIVRWVRVVDELLWVCVCRLGEECM